MNNLLTITGLEDSTPRTSRLLDSTNKDIESFDHSQLLQERNLATTTLLQIGDTSETLYQLIQKGGLRKDASLSLEDCTFIKEFYNFLCDKVLPF